VHDDLVTLKMVVVSEAPAERELLRRAASQVSVPLDVVEVGEAGVAAPTCNLLAMDPPDIVFLDSRMPKADRQEVVAAAHRAKGAPLVVLVGAADIKTREVITDGLPVDGVLAKPIDIAEAQAVLEGCVRARIPGRALIVDDSSTVRAIVKKVLKASRFRLEADEAEEGGAALECVRRQPYDIVFLDCNMPGVDGFMALAELRANYPHIQVVMITGSNDDKIPERAKAGGAKELLFKPFYAKDIDAILKRLFGLIPPKRAD
jgi:CheY-like chemotaxis protein